MKIEYPSEPILVSDGNGGAVPQWQNRRSIDLRHVMSAIPGGSAAHPWTEVYLVGVPQAFEIDVEYTRFLKDWHSVQP